MKTLILFTAALAISLACSNQPAGASNDSVSPDANPPVGPATTGAAAEREVTLPAGTVLPITLETSVGSDISRVEQPVAGRLRRAVTYHGVEVLPAGTALKGHVTAAQRPGRVKGRGYVAMRFTEIDEPGPGVEHMRTAQVSRLAPTTKQKDAVEILGPAAAGAVIGRVAGGASAAREGALIGGAAGTGYVLSTRGKDVRIGKGAPLSVKLTAPLVVKVRS
jgi:hypothetical protein